MGRYDSIFHLVHLWRVNATIAPRGLVHLATAPHCSFTHSTSPCAQLVFHHHNVPLQRPPKLGVANMGTTDHMDVVRYMHMVPCGQNAGSTPGSDGVQPTTLRNVVQHLCDRGANPSAGDNHAIRTAAKHGHVDVVRYLCDLPPDRGVDPSANDNHAIWAAASGGHVDVVRCLCDLPPDRGVNPSVILAIWTAASRGHVDVVRYLCDLPPDRGVDPSALDNRVIRDAAEHGHVDVVRYLCDLPPHRGVDPSAGDNRAILDAAQHGHLDVVRYLCDLPPSRGVDPRVWRPATVSASQWPVVRYMTYSLVTEASHAAAPSYNVRIANAITARSAARRPVLALCALVLGRHGRGTRVCAGRSVHST